MTHLSDTGDPTDFGEARDLIRGLVNRVTITPATATAAASIELEGNIVGMIDLALNAADSKRSISSAIEQAMFVWSVQVVAGTRNHRQLTPIRVSC